MIKIQQKQKEQLWWLIISVDFDYSRITIADHELNDEMLILWLEDKKDFKNSLNDCLKIEVEPRHFAQLIKAENFNSYIGTKMHPKKQFVYQTRIQINEPLQWYQHDATPVEQQWAREAVLRKLLNQLIEEDVRSIEWEEKENTSGDNWIGFDDFLYY